MKLSDMSTDQLAQALCDLTPPLCRIAADPAVSEALAAFAQGAEMDQPLLMTLSGVAQLLLPALLEDHTEDFFAVVSALTGKDVDTLRAQPGLTTLKELADCWDGEFADFFTSAGTVSPAKS